MAEALLAARVGFGLEGVGAFAEHGPIDEDANALGEAAGTLFDEALQDGGQEVRLFLVYHCWVGVEVFCRTPQSGPSVVHHWQRFLLFQALRGRGGASGEQITERFANWRGL